MCIRDSPYKKLVMEYCSYIDPRAKAIGAVNTVVNKNGLLYGYNTDYMGSVSYTHLFGQDILAPAVHQCRHDQRQIHGAPKAGIVGGKAVFRQIELPVQRVAVVLFPRQRPHCRGQQAHCGRDLVIVGGKVHLQLHAGEMCIRDRCPAGRCTAAGR